MAAPMLPNNNVASPSPGSQIHADDDENSPWARALAADVAALRSEGVSYRDSADFLRALVRKSSLKFTDIRDDPTKFFLAGLDKLESS